MNDLAAFATLVQALDAWRAHLIFIGGWAHRVHRLDPRANQLAYQPVFTKDSDLAFANKAPLEGDIRAALIGRGFKEELAGEFRPPVAHYALGDKGSGFYAEFLTPLAGSGYKRSGELDATMTAAGISAQKIRHLDILLVDPWVITVGPDNAIPLPAPVDIRVVNPLCFMVQKFLIQKDRNASKRAQDLLYIHDTLQAFANLLSEFNASWHQTVKPQLDQYGGHSVIVQKTAIEAFSTVDDTIRTAVRIPQDRAIDPEEFRLTCQISFEQIFSSP